MLFSIVVPIYNVEKYLDKCLDSIYKQTFGDYECIMINDGSTDNSLEICNKYCTKDERFVLVNKLNGGLVSARQKGAKLAKGKYIVCVDGDDWIKEEYLFQFSLIIEKFNPDVICCGAEWFYSSNHIESKPLDVREGFYDRSRIEKDIFPFLIHDEYGNYFPPSLWAKAFRNNIYKSQQLAVDTRIKIGEDISCTYPCIYESDSLYCLKNCLYYYRKNEQSMTYKKVFDWKGPKMIGEHLTNRTSESNYPFKDQIDRLVVHLLFNCCKTQFYKEKSYIKICREIRLILNETYYKEAIRECLYSKSYVQGRLAIFALKCRLFLLIKIYSVIR